MSSTVLQNKMRYKYLVKRGICPSHVHRKVQGNYVYCSECRERRKKWYDRYGIQWRAEYLWKQRVKDVQIGCCGVWHIVTAVPFRTPCCGRVFFERL